MKHKTNTARRTFLKTVALGSGPASLGKAAQSGQQPAAPSSTSSPSALEYPRTLTGRQLAMAAFPLGGIGTGCISLGGRGQLRDWEIFNRSDKGRSPDYCFASIRAQSGNRKPVVRVLEAELGPPYQADHGLGPGNVPGLPRLEEATFVGEFPLAKVAFQDSQLPVRVTLEAFSPFIPLDQEDSGLPVAVLRYRVSNSGMEDAAVSIAFALDNPVGIERPGPYGRPVGRTNDYRQAAGLEGLMMRNPALSDSDVLAGSVALCLLNVGTGDVTYLRGWPQAKWWTGPFLFWDDFTADGELGPEAAARRPVGALCLKRRISPGAEADYTFLLSWHFPNRTPERCGWRAPKGSEKASLGNHYCSRFPDAWAAAEYVAKNLSTLEDRTRRFAQVIRETTLPEVVKDAAASNLSTLVTPTCFRAADGEFYGFEGSNDQGGCCYGNCTHVWNYETATQHLFPTLSQSMRKTAFFVSSDSDGRMHFRQLLPIDEERYGVAAADGQMGQIVKAYLDWSLSGDNDWLGSFWPMVKRALEFAWIPGGWDGDQDGVAEGVQHNTFDLEFFGPNPQCGIWYLAALRAGEEMARAVGDTAAADRYRRLFENGSKWIDANLFNGDYYIQRIRAIPGSQIAEGLMSARGADDPAHPEEFQMGEGCLVDQLTGQYLAYVAGLGDLLDPRNVRKALQSIYKLNYKRSLRDHEAMQRVFALNDEAGLVICDYGAVKRPRVPFSFFGEVWTGLEYSAATLMLFTGMASEGLECIENIRRRYDGEKRNPWDEAECGHHYARAMASWSALVALSGFRYHGASKRVAATPRLRPSNFSSFWSTATGWGKFTHVVEGQRLHFTIAADEGTLPLRSITLRWKPGGRTSVVLENRPLPHVLHQDGEQTTVSLADSVTLRSGEEFVVVL